MRRRRGLTLIAASCLVSSCMTLPNLEIPVGQVETPEIRAAREKAEEIALDGFGGYRGAPGGDAEWVLVGRTEYATYGEFMRRGLAVLDPASEKIPAFLLHSKPKDVLQNEYRLVRTLVVDGLLRQQSASRRVAPFGNVDIDGNPRAEFLVSTDFPQFGDTVTFTIKGVKETRPIKFFLGTRTIDGGLVDKWLPIGDATAVDGVVSVSTVIREVMGLYPDWSLARFERGRAYNLGYKVEGKAIEGCPLGVYLPTGY